MTAQHSGDHDSRGSWLGARGSKGVRIGGHVVILVGLIAVDPVIAQTDGTVTEAFCTSEMALTIQNLFTVIQLGGPLIGGVLALGATVALPTVRRADLKKEMKEVRNQGLIWGVIVAPLATYIVRFLLNNVVAGGTSCAF